MPQVSNVSKFFGIQQINVQHFTWDWLYFSLYGDDYIFRSLKNDYETCGEFVFPPLTPKDNLKMYPHKNINLIVNRKLISMTSVKKESKKINESKTILLMNNGTQSLNTLNFSDFRKFPKKLWMDFNVKERTT